MAPNNYIKMKKKSRLYLNKFIKESRICETPCIHSQPPTHTHERAYIEAVACDTYISTRVYIYTHVHARKRTQRRMGHATLPHVIYTGGLYVAVEWSCGGRVGGRVGGRTIVYSADY